MNNLLFMRNRIKKGDILYLLLINLNFINQ